MTRLYTVDKAIADLDKSLGSKCKGKVRQDIERILIRLSVNCTLIGFSEGVMFKGVEEDATA